MRLNGISNQRFNGVYIVKGQEFDVSNFKEYAKNNALVADTLDIKLGETKLGEPMQATIIATNDSTLPKEEIQAVLETQDIKTRSQKNFLKDLCAKVFDKRVPIGFVDIPVNIYDVTNFNTGLRWDKDQQTLLDGSSVKTNFGVVEERKMQDGNVITYYVDSDYDPKDVNGIKHIKNPDGVVLESYHKDGTRRQK